MAVGFSHEHRAQHAAGRPGARTHCSARVAGSGRLDTACTRFPTLEQPADLAGDLIRFTDSLGGHMGVMSRSTSLSATRAG